MQGPISLPSLPSVPGTDQTLIPDQLRFPVVGLGASTGGLQALIRFFENMPPNSDMAFVVILHLSPAQKSNAAAVLQGTTRMPVRQVMEPTMIEKNHVYVIPPGKHLSMNDSYLRISDPEHPAGKLIAIDLFFRALADVHKERAVGIVLSGTGADGAVGLARIKEEGGVTFAQSPDDAEYDGMPRAAIETGVVDFVLPALDIPRRLVELWRDARSLTLPPIQDPDAPVTATAPGWNTDAEQAFQDIIAHLRAHTGHDFRHYKRATVLRRIERRLHVCRLPDLASYRDRLAADSDENAALFNDLLIGVTNFFRDRDAFDALERKVITELFKRKQAHEQVRAWVAGCATGEEAYSLTMLLCERACLRESPPGIHVFATDIDERAIATARAGSYPESIVADIPPARLRQFFVKEDRRYRIKKTVRDRILFATHDLLKDPPFSRLDLIVCRNLLIYLTREAQAQLLETFHFALNPGGYLFLGSSESADASGLFTPVDKENRIYSAKAVLRSSRHIPALPTIPAARMPSAAMDKLVNRRKFSFADMHQKVVAQYASPSLVVDQDSKIVHMSEGIGRFLRYVGGEPSIDVISLVLPELRLELRTVLHQAIHKRKSVEARRLEIKRDGHAYRVNIMARPFHDDDAEGDFVLVLFDEAEETMTADAAKASGTDVSVILLEQELRQIREQLQETIERSEISTEELKASNEELQAINEELRTATEEIETSKEELQSVNEELVTVNHELKMQVEETSKVNDDLNNFIASTEIATIFVDQGLHIKRYTPRATDIFNIIPADIGRSLLDITHRLAYAKLTDDAATTFASLRPVEREVSSNDGRFYIARMLPYRTTEDRIRGAVLTFIDITSRHRAEDRVRAGERRIQLFAESTKDYAIMTADREGRITSWNKGAERMFGHTEDEAIGQKLDMIYSPEDIAAGIPDEERKTAREQGRAEDERWLIRKDGTRLFCGGIVNALKNADFDGYAKITSELSAHTQGRESIPAAPQSG
jgi:two-component system CheB/CheR fusion protein